MRAPIRPLSRADERRAADLYDQPDDAIDDRDAAERLVGRISSE